MSGRLGCLRRDLARSGAEPATMKGITEVCPATAQLRLDTVITVNED